MLRSMYFVNEIIKVHMMCIFFLVVWSGSVDYIPYLTVCLHGGYALVYDIVISYSVPRSALFSVHITILIQNFFSLYCNTKQK